jgi:hypothetical protein
MAMGRCRLGVAWLFFAFAAGAPTSARADDQAACTKSYENAQILKKNRQYIAARRELLVCLRECPAVVQRECGRWFDGLESVVPSIVIHTEAAGEDRSDVKVEIDGKVLAERVDGKGIDVDPGQHDLTFSLAGFPSVKKNIVMHEGEQLRVIRVLFEKPEAGAKVVAPPAMYRPVPAAVYVAGGIGVAGIIGFAAFGSFANSQRDHYENSCSPHCVDAAVNAVHTNYLIADISLGVGLAALATGAVIWLVRPSVPAVSEGAVVAVAPTHGGAIFSGTLRY